MQKAYAAHEGTKNPRHFEFFARDLVSGVHYVEVAPPAAPEPLTFMDMCVDLSRQVRAHRWPQ